MQHKNDDLRVECTYSKGKNTNQAKTSELGNKEIVGSNDKCTLKYY